MSFFGIGQKIERVIGKEQELLDAARNGNLDAVEKLLVNRTKKSTGALGSKLSSFLKNVNVNYTDKNGYTALHHAAVNGHRDVVEALLKADAQPGVVDNQGCTPVHLAAWNGNAEIVMQLLTAGTIPAESESGAQVNPVNVNHQNSNGDTALHCAANYGNVPVVDVLLQKSANPTIRNLNEESALDLAAQYGKLEVVQLLLIKFPDLSHRPACTQSTLHLASRNGHRDIVEVLLNNNFDIQTKTETGSALHEAALHGKLDVVKLLLDSGIDINLCDKDGRTALQLLSDHQAQQKSFTEITQTIKDHMTKTDTKYVESDVYERLSSYSSGEKPMATVRPLTPDKPPVTDKPIIKTPDKSSPASRRSQYNPSPPPVIDTPLTPTYSKPNKEKSSNPERVISTTSSMGDPGPPPLPPRMSIHPQEDTTNTGKDIEGVKAEGSPGPSPKSMVVPKKPPRQKRSPVPARHSMISKSTPSPEHSPVSPHPPASVENIPDTSLNIPAVSVSSNNSSQHSISESDQSQSVSDSSHKSLDQNNQGYESENTPNKSEIKHSPSKPKISPKPSLPPRSSPVLAKSVKNSPVPSDTTSPSDKVVSEPIVQPNQTPTQLNQTVTQANQAVYLEMKPKPKPRQKPEAAVKETSEVKVNTPEVQSQSSLKPAEVKVDHYGILFPNLKNVSPKSRPKLLRANTAPEENTYVGPLPTSPAEKFKEKQGMLRRINTAPEDPTYTPMTGPAELESHDPTRENEYAEIPEKLGSRVSPVENIYATIPEVKKETDDKTSGGAKLEQEPDVSADIEKLNDASSENTIDIAQDVPKLPERNGIGTKGSKPTYLDFVKKQPSQPLTPTGYPQPPTPDHPPPSPATAMLGIEQKIQEMDTKRKSRDMTTLTDDYLDQFHEHKQEQSVTHSTETKVSQGLFRSELSVKGDRLSRETIKEEGNSENQIDLQGNSENLNFNDQKQVEIETDRSTISAIKAEVCENTVINTDQTKDIPVSSIPTPTVIQNTSNMADSNSANQKTEESLDGTQPSSEAGGESPVVMRRKSSTSTPDMDMFKGLLRGSTIGGPRKGLSLVYNEVQRQSEAGRSVPSTYMTINTLMEEEGIDVDQVMKTIDNEVAKRASAHDSSGFDDSEEWAQIQDIMASFGSGIARESVFIRDFEPAFTKLIAGSMQSVGEWLESLGLGQYENAFIANGYDNVDFLDNKILEEQDLEQIGVLNHEHRRQILLAAKNLPQLKPIDNSKPPVSVEEWLMSLQLLDYLETFTSHGYDTMEKVESILWELQLRTVLDISQLGHRKRILASLGDRHPPDRATNSLKKKSLSSVSQDNSRQPFSDINLFRDYTKVKPTSSSEEDVKESTQMAIDSSEDEDRIGKKKKPVGQSIRNSSIHLRPPHMAQTTSSAKQWRHKPEMLIKGCCNYTAQGGQSIRNSNIHLRPPHLTQTTSPARKWRHNPDMLIKGSCNYTAQYLGSTIVPDLTGGTESTREGITKLKHRFMQQLQKSTDVLAKIPVIMLSISYKGVKFIDAKSKKVICDHDIGNIFCACQDTENLNFFAYITRDIETAKHYCHVFSVKSSSLAHDIILTLGESFEVAYQMALKEKSMKEAMELDQKMMSQSDTEDVYSQSAKVSTNTL